MRQTAAADDTGGISDSPQLITCDCSFGFGFGCGWTGPW
jgi:hypothetical protein